MQTGLWDGIHPAGLAIFCLALLIAIALRKGFCGYICPVGFVHNLLERLGRKLNATRRIPRKIATVLLAPKYLLLAFFTYTVWFSMPLEAVERFMRAPYNLVADAKMLLFFMHPSATAIAVFAALAILGAIFPYFWCRFLCPYGALLGIGALLSPLAIKRRADECIDCGKCDRACPGGIQVSVKDRVNSAECVGCMQCTGVCPTQCLDAKAGSARIHPAAVAVAVVGLFLAGYAIAELTGHWDADFAPQMLKRIYMSTLH